MSLLRSFYLLLLVLAAAPQAAPKNSPVNLKVWRGLLGKTNIEVGCHLQKQLGYQDPTFNCNTRPEDLGPNAKCTISGRPGPVLPKQFYGKIASGLVGLRFVWKDGKLTEMQWVFNSSLWSEKKLQTAFGFGPQDLLNGLYMAVVCGQGTICLSLFTSNFGSGDCG